MKVLVGVDGSSNSFAAVGFVGQLISPERDELTLFFATPAMTFDDERLDAAVEERARSALSRAVLDAALERLPAAWQGRVLQKEVAGPPSAALLNGVREQGAELVVLGFRGTSGYMEQFMLGSVSRAVVHSAKVSVLVVKGTSVVDAQSTSLMGVNRPRVLAAYDGPPAAEPMAKLLGQFTWPEQAHGWVMTVVRPMFLADLPDWVISHPRDPDVAAMAAAWETEHQQNLAAARDELDRFRKTLPTPFAHGEAIVAEGSPAEQIMAKVREMSINLAVLGGRGSGTVKRLLLGSTSSQVLGAAPCSVLIVR